jgi:hypothetical protein
VRRLLSAALVTATAIAVCVSAAVPVDAAPPLTTSATGFEVAHELAADPVDIVAPGQDDVWVSGRDAADNLVLEHGDDGTWSRYEFSTAYGGDLATAGGDVWAIADGRVQQLVDDEWQAVPDFSVVDEQTGEPHVVAPRQLAAAGGGSVYVQLEDRFARWTGEEWDDLGLPPGMSSLDYRRAIQEMTVSEGQLLVLDSGLFGSALTYHRYDGDAWSPSVTPFGEGDAARASTWLVESPTDVWLFRGATCVHFDGSAVDDTPCVTGADDTLVTETALLADGTQLIESETYAFARIRQADARTRVLVDLPAGVTTTKPFGYVGLAAEPGRPVVWTAVQTTAGPVALRWDGTGEGLGGGPNPPAPPAAFTVSAAPAARVLPRGARLVVTGRVTPAPRARADRAVVLQVRAPGRAWRRAGVGTATARGTFRLARVMVRPGRYQVRVRKPATADRGAATSRVFAVRVGPR